MMKWFGRQSYRGWQLNIAAVLTFAVGIGTLGAVLSIMDGVIWRPLAYPDGEQLFTLWQVDRKSPTDLGVTSLPNYEDWKLLNHSFTDLGAFTQGTSILATDTGAVEVTNESVSANLLSILQVQPELGRLFRQGDDQPGSSGGADPAILSYRFWVKGLGRNPKVIGTHLTIDNHSYSVVGVMPRGFEFPVGDKVDLWTSLAGFSERRVDSLPIANHRDARRFEVLGRLRPLVSIDEARQDMERVAKDLAARYPAMNARTNIVILSAVDWIAGLQYGALLKVFLVAVVFVVLICCVNIAGLQLARWLDNRRNFAIRLALGASVRHLHYRHLRECFLIAICGGCLGLVGGYILLKTIIRMIPIDIPRLATVSYNLPVVLEVAASVIVGALLFYVPVLFAKPFTHANVLLKEHQGHQVTYSPRAKRIFQGLVATEAVCASILLVSALSAVSYVNKLTHERLGFNSHGVLTLQISLPREHFRGRAINDYFTKALSTLAEIPGVVQSSAASAVPMVQRADYIGVISRGAASGGTTIQSMFQTAEPEYFRTLQVPVRGREFSEQDQERSLPVVIINERLAHLLFGDQDPIGKVIVPTVPDMSGQYKERVIVGVSNDVRSDGIGTTELPEVWVPESQVPMRTMIVVLRTRRGAAAEVQSVTGVMKQIGSGAVVSRVSEMDEAVRERLKQPRFSALVAFSFAVIAMLLTTVALQGLTSYSVARSSNEFGIRIACGATRSSIRWKVVSDATLLVCAAGALGATLSDAVIRLVASTFGVPLEFNLEAYLGAVAVLGFVCSLGCIFGTRQIERLQAWETLK